MSAKAQSDQPAIAVVIPDDPMQVLHEMKLPEEFNARLREGTITGPAYTEKEAPKPQGGAVGAGEPEPKAEPKPEAAKKEETPAETPALASATEAPASHETPPAPKGPKPGVKPLKLAKRYEGTKAAEQFTPEKIAEITAQAATAAVKAIAQENAAETPPAEEIQLLPEEQEALRVLGEMEKLHPDKYKGIVDKTKGGLREYDRRVAAWQEANPGQTWDENGADAEALRNETSPQWDPGDYKAAEREIVVSPLKQQYQKLQDRLAELEGRQHQQELAPVVLSKAVEVGKAAAADLGAPEDIIGANGTFDQAKADALRESDPAGQIILQTVAVAENFAAAATTLLAGGTIDNNQLAQGVAQATVDLERDVQQLPAKDRLYEGREFRTRKDYFHLPAKERGKYWIVDAEDVIAKGLHDEARGILSLGRQQAEAERQRATKFGWKPPTKPAKAGAAAAPGSTPPPEQPRPAARREGHYTEPAVTRFKPRTVATVGSAATPPPAVQASREGSFMHRVRHGTIDSNSL